MKSFIYLVAIFMISPAFAEEIHGQPVTQYRLELDAADMVSLSAALMELPKKVADPLIAKITSQVQAQVNQKQSTDQKSAK